MRPRACSQPLEPTATLTYSFLHTDRARPEHVHRPKGRGEPYLCVLARALSHFDPQSDASHSDFKPNAIVALGGGSVIDCAKIARLLYEHPKVKLEVCGARFCSGRCTA
jgi:hypothetical protein